MSWVSRGRPQRRVDDTRREFLIAKMGGITTFAHTPMLSDSHPMSVAAWRLTILHNFLRSFVHQNRAYQIWGYSAT
jgi:hypothetical protein